MIEIIKEACVTDGTTVTIMVQAADIVEVQSTKAKQEAEKFAGAEYRLIRPAFVLNPTTPEWYGLDGQPIDREAFKTSKPADRRCRVGYKLRSSGT